MDGREGCGSHEGYDVGLGPDGEVEFEGGGHRDDVLVVIDNVEIWNDAEDALRFFTFDLLDGRLLCEYGGDAGLDCRDLHFDVIEIEVLARLQGDFLRVPLAEAGSRDGQTVGVAGIETGECEMAG